MYIDTDIILRLTDLYCSLSFFRLFTLNLFRSEEERMSDRRHFNNWVSSWFNYVTIKFSLAHAKINYVILFIFRGKA